MNRRLNETDSALFRAEVADAEPVQHEVVEPHRDKPAPWPRPREPESFESSCLSLSEAEVETHDYLLFSSPGIQKRLLLELQRGQLEPQIDLDLHGLRVVEAESLVREFLAHCHEKRIRCARIIHGKGLGSEDRQPVLKRKVNYWLRLREDVLAFCSAPRHQGGTGATHLLLRNPEKSRRRRR